MSTSIELAPGVPDDYYRRIMQAEQTHYWYRGMESIASALLGDRMNAGLRVLDAGCGAGGFLRFLLDKGRFASAAGVDIATAAIDLARERVPEADLRLSPLHELPFPDASFDLVVSNDVLQHIHEGEMQASLAEIHRVLAGGGSILLRTNGSRRLRRERADWRAYDRATLQGVLTEAGFTLERLTYVNLVQSLTAAAIRRSPHAPTEEHHGVPPVEPGPVRSALGRLLLATEARWLARRGHSLPFGHNLIALAVTP